MKNEVPAAVPAVPIVRERAMIDIILKSGYVMSVEVYADTADFKFSGTACTSYSIEFVDNISRAGVVCNEIAGVVITLIKEPTCLSI